MKKRVIIHAGSPKTGTTSLQHGMLRRRQELSDHGILYPAIQSTKVVAEPSSDYSLEEQGDVFSYFPSSHASLFWRGRTVALPRHFQSERLPEIEKEWQDVLSAFRDGPHHTLIISAETLLFRHAVHGLDEVLPAFHGMDKVLAVCLRHPEELLHSLYCQGVKSYPQTTVPARKHFALPAYLDGGYAGLVAALVEAVGPNEVRQFWMSDQWKGGRTIVGGFLSLLGLDVPVEQEFRSNPTPDEETILLLRLLNRRKVPFHIVNDLNISENQGSARGRKRQSSLYPEPLQQRIAARFARDVEILSRRHGLAADRAPQRPILPFRDRLSNAEALRIIDRILPGCGPLGNTMIRRLRERLAAGERVEQESADDD